MDSLMETVNNPIIVDKVREKLVSEMTANPDLYDGCDLEKVRSNDWTIKRFLLVMRGDVDNAFVAARDAMKWRKSYEVNLRSDLDFPLEFYKIGALFPYCEDREGRDVIYFRIKLHKTFPKFSEVLKAFIIHLINKIDAQNGEKGFVMVWDLTGAGPSNWDLSMVRFIISSFRNYFPSGMKCLYIYGVPWIMNPFVTIALKLMPEEARKRVKHVSKDQIFEFIEQTNIPDFMGGQCGQSYRESPKGVREAKEMAEERGWTVQEVENLLKYYEKDLE